MAGVSAPVVRSVSAMRKQPDKCAVEFVGEYVSPDVMYLGSQSLSVLHVRLGAGVVMVRPLKLPSTMALLQVGERVRFRGATSLVESATLPRNRILVEKAQIVDRPERQTIADFGVVTAIGDGWVALERNGIEFTVGLAKSVECQVGQVLSFSGELRRSEKRAHVRPAKVVSETAHRLTKNMDDVMILALRHAAQGS